MKDIRESRKKLNGIKVIEFDDSSKKPEGYRIPIGGKGP